RRLGVRPRAGRATGGGVPAAGAARVSRGRRARTPAPTAPATAAGGHELAIGLSAAILPVTAGVPRVLVVNRAAHALAPPLDQRTSAFDALPFGPLDPAGDRTLERALRGWVRAQTGLELGYTEQLYTFGDRGRFPDAEETLRVVSV